MNIGIVGLGRLGLPVACAIASRGHTVYGWDINDVLMAFLQARASVANPEPEIDRLLIDNARNLRFGSLAEISGCDIIFVAVPTPHPPEMDSSKLYTGPPRDFDYSILETTLKSLRDHLKERGTRATIGIMSTVSPGTTRKLTGLFDGFDVDLFYTPSFISLGSVYADFLNPPFSLIGTSDIGVLTGAAARKGTFGRGFDPANVLPTDTPLEVFYRSIHGAERFVMRWEEAELAKLLYNGFQSLKIAFANEVGILCHKFEANSDMVMHALKADWRNIAGPGYLKPGLPDGGPCRPRDLQVLSYLQSGGLFAHLVEVREAQALQWAGLILARAEKHKLPILIAGRAYKAGVELEDGSPALLIANCMTYIVTILVTANQPSDPYLKDTVVAFYDPKHPPEHPVVLFLGTAERKSWSLPNGSVLIDPWGCVENVTGSVEIVRVGRE